MGASSNDWPVGSTFLTGMGAEAPNSNIVHRYDNNIVEELQMIEIFSLESTRVCEAIAKNASSTKEPFAICTIVEATALRPDLNTFTENS